MVLGPDHPDVGVSLNDLAVLYQRQGRDGRGRAALPARAGHHEKALGPEHPVVGTVLNNLAELYGVQGRYAEAEPLHQRALAIREKALGPDHPDVGASLNNLAGLYRAQGRTAEAEPLYKRSLAIFEKGLGPDHSDVGTSLNNLAELFQAQGRAAEAEPLHRRALANYEKALGPDHPLVGTSLNNLAGLYRDQGRYAEAEPLYKRDLAITEKALGPDHPSVGTTLDGLAGLYFVQRDWARAADFGRRSTTVIVRRARRGTDDVGQALTGKRKSEAEQESYRFGALVKAVHRLASQGGADASPAREMFQTAQWALASEAAASLAQMAARQAKGDDDLSRQVRKRQDLVGEWQARDKLLITAISQPPDKRNAAVERQHRARLGEIDTEVAKIDRTLKEKFPEYAALANPEPLSIADVQAHLRAEEALIFFLDTRDFQPLPEETFIWVVTKADIRWVRSDLGTTALAQHVAALRCGLDEALWNDGDSSDKCVKLVKASRFDGVGFTGALPFDLERAHELYKALLGPAEDLIKDKHLLIVPSGPLTSLPFNALVTEAPKTRIADSPAEYRDAAWLGIRQPISVLPSAASLKALRAHAKNSRATKAFLGIGNPLLDGPGDDYSKQAEAARAWQRCSNVPAQWQAVASARGRRSIPGLKSLFRGPHANIEYVRQQTPLPETADELCRIARGLGAPESEILLGRYATETTVKDLSEKGQLAEYRTVHFATHGALAGELKGLSEPGLILTPPPSGTSDAKLLERDDGYLTASEVATLKLDADWVILSACNTAGAAGESAEALSGLARAFFYAGARTLLVSHWAVASDAAVKLTTRVFEELKANPNIGRAEAFRISMRELIHNGSSIEAHPMQWAPFVVVGDGAAAR